MSMFNAPLYKIDSMHPDLIRHTTTARIPTAEGAFQLSHYLDTRDGKEHLALVMGEVQGQHNVLVRVHSECFTGDVLGSQRCDCGEQLHQAMHLVAQAGLGVILYLRQEGRGIGLEEKLKAYNLQDQGYDTVDANLMLGHQADEREYSAAAAILADLGILSIRLMTNNPAKLDHLAQLGVTINERHPLSSTVTRDNAAYLATKIQRMRHMLTLPLYTNGHSHAHTPAQSEIDYRLADLHTRATRHYAECGQPWITLSYAQTLDGTLGAAQGGPLAISSPEAMVVTHRLRAQHDAILIGVGTLLADNPKLTVRLVEGPSPQPIIVDTHLRTPLDAPIWHHPKAPWIATLDTASPHAVALAARGARLLQVPADANGKVHLAALFATLSAAGLRSMMVEGGARILANLLQQQLAHFAVITVAPRFIPGIRIGQTNDAVMTAIHQPEYTQVGGDIMIWGQMTGPKVSVNLPLAAAAPANSYLPSPSLSAPL